MKRTFFSILSAIALTTALVACGSNVKLDEAPVENRTATVVDNQSGAASGVKSVDLVGNNSGMSGPVGATKIIYFDYDSYVVKPEFQAVVEAHAKFIVANKSRKLAIEGHTDERGGREYNLALGQKRSEAVRRALGLLGVPDAQVEAVSFGKEKPAASGSDEAAFAQNRRAELNYR